MNDDTHNDVGSLLSMVTAQALVWCLRGCFSYNNKWEKTPIYSGKKQFFTYYVYNGLCNEPKFVIKPEPQKAGKVKSMEK